MPNEIGHGHLTRSKKGCEACEEADGDQDAGDELDRAGGDQHWRQWMHGKRNRKSEEFRRCMFEEQEPGHDAKDGEQLRLPAGKPGEFQSRVSSCYPIKL